MLVILTETKKIVLMAFIVLEILLFAKQKTIIYHNF